MDEQNTQARPRLDRALTDLDRAELDLIRIGPSSTDFIPRKWAEQMLAILRDENTRTWQKLIGRVSSGG